MTVRRPLLVLLLYSPRTQLPSAPLSKRMSNRTCTKSPILLSSETYVFSSSFPTASPNYALNPQLFARAGLPSTSASADSPLAPLPAVAPAAGPAPSQSFSPSTPPPPPAAPSKGGPEIYIHGWVYDVENGKVSDLGVSVGPPGCALPFSPFPVVGAVAAHAAAAEGGCAAGCGAVPV